MVLVMITVVVSPRWIVWAVVVTVRVTLQLQRMQAAAISDSTAITRYLRIAQPPLLVAHLVARHKLGHQEGAQHVVLLLSVEANFSGRTLGGVRHLSLGIIACVPEQVTLRQHTCGDSGAGVAELRDVRFLSKTVDRKIGVGVTAGLAVNLLNRVFENDFLILGHSVKWVCVSKVKGQKRLAESADIPVEHRKTRNTRKLMSHRNHRNHRKKIVSSDNHR